MFLGCNARQLIGTLQVDALYVVKPLPRLGGLGPVLAPEANWKRLAGSFSCNSTTPKP